MSLPRKIRVNEMAHSVQLNLADTFEHDTFVRYRQEISSILLSDFFLTDGKPPGAAALR